MNIAIRVLLFRLQKDGDGSLYYDSTQSNGQSYRTVCKTAQRIQDIHIYIYIFYEEAYVYNKCHTELEKGEVVLAQKFNQEYHSNVND
jgi:hypothetical protein